MDKQIKKILKDLYKMDKYFKQNKKEVEQIVRKIIENRPDVKVDSNFVLSLKSELENALPAQEVIIKKPLFKNISTVFVTRVGYGLAGAVAVAVLAIPVVYFGFNRSSSGNQLTSSDNTVNTVIVSTTSTLASGKDLTVKQKLLAQNKIIKFKDLKQAETFLKNNPTNSYNDYGAVGGRGGMGEVTKTVSLGVPETASSLSSDSSGSSGSTNDYSQTNVQVQGVDEADIIKTDGKYLYVVKKQDLYIIDAYPADKAKVLTKISFDKSFPSNIYINGNSLIVFGSESYASILKSYPSFIRRNSFSFFKVFDITDKSKPKQVRDLDIEGYYKDSRMIGDYVYFVSDNYGFSYIEGEPIVPRIIADGKTLPNSCKNNSTNCFTPDVYYFDVPYTNYNFVTVNAINIKDNTEKITGDVYINPSNSDMYVSSNNMYLTYVKYISDDELSLDAYKIIIYPKLSTDKKNLIAKIQGTDNYILSRYEKNQKTLGVYYSYTNSLSSKEQTELYKKIEAKMKSLYSDVAAELQKTVIHKIGIDKGSLTYKATGEVTGKVLNQFSMDEYDGYFRLATTKNRTWSRYETANTKSYNNLYILDKNMKLSGKVEKLAEGEIIYSVRFMQNRAYMVTFKQTDPLFVIDVQNPKAPKVLGKLKIPGFSDYLHPYDDTTLIGVGKDTELNSSGGVITKGVKLSLFDVSNVSKPKETSSYIMGGRGSNTPVSQDHKAFLFDKKKNILSLPVYLTEDKGTTYGNFVFGGAYVFTVDKTDGFKLKGKIDHADSKLVSSGGAWTGYSYYDRNVKRSFYINDTLYTYSEKYLKANKISDLTEIKKLEIKKTSSSSGDDYDIVN